MQMEEAAVAHRHFLQPQAHHVSPGLNDMGVLSLVIGLLQVLLQVINQGIGSPLPHSHMISIHVFICLFAFTASIALPPNYSTICVRISIFFAILACASLLSPIVPNKLSLAPYLSCIYPVLHLLSSDFRRALQQLCKRIWDAASDAVCKAYHALSTSLQSIRHSILEASSSSAPRSLEEGGARSNNHGNNHI